jgi:TRAP-type C4-dicarboxylate transport system permease small subunit
MGRYFYKPITGASEIGALLLGLLIFSAFPLVTRDQQHICVGLLDHVFSGWVKRVRDFVVFVASIMAVTFMGWRLWKLAQTYVAEGRVEDLTGIPRAPVTFVLSVLCFFTSVLLIGVLIKFLRHREPATAAEVADPPDPS